MCLCLRPPARTVHLILPTRRSWPPAARGDLQNSLQPARGARRRSWPWRTVLAHGCQRRVRAIPPTTLAAPGAEGFLISEAVPRRRVLLTLRTSLHSEYSPERRIWRALTLWRAPSTTRWRPTVTRTAVHIASLVEGGCYPRPIPQQSMLPACERHRYHQRSHPSYRPHIFLRRHPGRRVGTLDIATERRG